MGVGIAASVRAQLLWRGSPQEAIASSSRRRKYLDATGEHSPGESPLRIADREVTSVFLINAADSLSLHTGSEDGLMGILTFNEMKKRTKVIVDGQPWLIVDADFVKPGKGQAFTRVKLKNLVTGRVLERTYKSNETVQEADISVAQMQYLFGDGTNFTFMNNKNYEQIEISGDIIGDDVRWLKENELYEVSFWNDKVISVTPPNFLVLKVIEAEPAVKGDTATSVTKKAKLETGAEIDVPLFIEPGTILKIDTRSGEYIGRV